MNGYLVAKPATERARSGPVRSTEARLCFKAPCMQHSCDTELVGSTRQSFILSLLPRGWCQPIGTEIRHTDLPAMYDEVSNNRDPCVTPVAVPVATGNCCCLYRLTAVL